MSRPFISYPLHNVKPEYENAGYIISGSRHKLMCRCYACQAIRRKAREVRLRREMGWLNESC